jgi:hypothetical protein
LKALDFTASHFRPLRRMWMKFYRDHNDEVNDKAALDTRVRKPPLLWPNCPPSNNGETTALRPCADQGHTARQRRRAANHGHPSRYR